MIALTLLLLTQPASAFSAPSNPSFETGDFTDWQHWGDDTVVGTTGAYDGTYAVQLKLDPSASGSQEYGLYQDVSGLPIGAHLQFTVIASMSTIDPLSPGARLVVKWEAFNGGSYQGASESSVPLAVDGSFGYGKVDVVVPANNTMMRYTLLFQGPAGGASGTVYVDTTQISPYTDDFCPEILDQPQDADGDQVGDACDVCIGDDNTGDADADTICDNLDVCVGDDSVGDADGDAVCDDLDACEGDDATGDADGDGLCADSDPNDAGDTDVAEDTDVSSADTDVAAEDTDVAVNDTDDGDSVDSGCGCAQSGAPIALAPVALLAFAARRRRRS